MKILYVGDDWIGSNARSLADGFRSAGHDVLAIDSTAVSLPRRLSPPWVYSKVKHRRAPWVIEQTHRTIEQAASSFRPDVVFGFKSVHLDQARLLEVQAPLHVHYSPDDASNPYNTSPEYLEHESAWDLIVTTKRHNVPELLARGARKALFVHSAYDPAWHRPTAKRRATNFDVGFIGACRPDRRGLIVDLARTHGNKMLVQGPGWRRVPELRTSGAHVAGAVYGEDFSVAVAAVTSNLVLLNSDNRDTHTCRTFEVPAAGGLFVGERTDEHSALLVDEKEALLFSDPAELAERLDWCRAHPSEAATIAERGFQRIVDGHHTYADRAKEIIDELVG